MVIELYKNKPSLVATNRMTARELMGKENALIVFHDFENMDGKKRTYFTCGSITGYVSPNAVKESKNNTNYLDNLVYADVSEGGGKLVPCLMKRPIRNISPNREKGDKKQNTKRSKESERCKLNLSFSSIMPAKELAIKQKASLDYHDYDDIEDVRHVYFTCGNICGYVSPRIEKEIPKKEYTIDDFVYALISNGGGEPIPFLIWKSEGLLELQDSIADIFLKVVNTEYEISARIKEAFEVGIYRAKQVALKNRLKPPFDLLVIKSNIKDEYLRLKYNYKLESKCKNIGINFESKLNMFFIKYFISYSIAGINNGSYDFATIEGNSKYIEFPDEGYQDIVSDIRTKIFDLLLKMMHYTYGNIEENKDHIAFPSILALPLLDACIMCEDSENIKNMCKNIGVNHLELIIEAAQLVIRHFVVKEEPTCGDLFF